MIIRCHFDRGQFGRERVFIPLIKLYRTITNTGLREAKDWVEKYLEEHGVTYSAPSALPEYLDIEIKVSQWLYSLDTHVKADGSVDMEKYSLSLLSNVNAQKFLFITYFELRKHVNDADVLLQLSSICPFCSINLEGMDLTNRKAHFIAHRLSEMATDHPEIKTLTDKLKASTPDAMLTVIFDWELNNEAFKRFLEERKSINQLLSSLFKG